MMRVFLLPFIGMAGVASAEIQTPARVSLDGFDVSGACDLRIALYDVASGGTPLAGPESFDAVDVSRGWLDVSLAFTDFEWDAKNPPFVGLEARCGDATAFETLSPRERVSAAPWALVADRSTSHPWVVAHGASSVALPEDVEVTVLSVPVVVAATGILDVSVHGSYVVDENRITTEYPPCTFSWDSYQNGGAELNFRWESDAGVIAAPAIEREPDQVTPVSFGQPLESATAYVFRQSFPVTAGGEGTLIVTARGFKDPRMFECVAHVSSGARSEYVGGAAMASLTAILRPEVSP